MSIAEELLTLSQNISDLQDAIIAKGGTVTGDGLVDLVQDVENIPSGGGDTPTDWGIVYYYDTFDLSIDEVRGENCSAEVTNPQLLLSKALETGMSSVDMMFDYQPGEGWMNWEFSDTPYTTEELLTVFGIAVSDFDENDWAMLEIRGEIALVKNGSPKQMVLTSEEEYNSLTSTSENPVISLVKIVKFTFGRNATSVPNSFLSQCQNLEAINTDYTSSITTIGNDVFSYTEIVGKVRFENVTTVGYGFLLNVKYAQVELPNVTSVGDSFCTGILRIPLLPKLEQAGDSFLQAAEGFPSEGNTIGINVFETMPNLVSLGRKAFSNCFTVSRIFLSMPVSQVCPNLQHIGAGFCGGCNNLIDCSNVDQSWIDIIENDFAGTQAYSFSASTNNSSSYLAGIQASTNFKTKFPEVTLSGRVYRKYRTS